MTRTNNFKTRRTPTGRLAAACGSASASGTAAAVALAVIMMSALAPTTWAIGGGLANDTSPLLSSAPTLDSNTTTLAGLRLRGRALPASGDVPSNDKWAKCVTARACLSAVLWGWGWEGSALGVGTGEWGVGSGEWGVGGGVGCVWVCGDTGRGRDGPGQ